MALLPLMAAALHRGQIWGCGDALHGHLGIFGNGGSGRAQGQIWGCGGALHGHLGIFGIGGGGRAQGAGEVRRPPPYLTLAAASDIFFSWLDEVLSTPHWQVLVQILQVTTILGVFLAGSRFVPYGFAIYSCCRGVLNPPSRRVLSPCMLVSRNRSSKNKTKERDRCI